MFGWQHWNATFLTPNSWRNTLCSRNVFTVKEHYKSENSMIRLWKEFCTEVASCKEPIKILSDIYFCSLKKLVA
jgi:hypothetical protein